MVLQTASAWLLKADAAIEEFIPLVLAWSWTIFAAGAIVLIVRLNSSADRPKRYKVPLPKLPEETRYLDPPSIKVPGSSAIQCYAPATGQFLGLVNPSTPAAIDRAVAAAKAAQTVWASTTTFRDRRRVLRSLLKHVIENQKDICRIACLDSGKLPLDAALGEVYVVAERIQWTLKHGEAALRPSKRPTNALLMPHKRNYIEYEPLGVVAALVSWNYPFHNLLAPMVSALFAGNAIVVKASEQTAWSTQYFTALMRGALVAHGHDPALVQAVVCWPATASHLTQHPDIAHLTFIGSQAVAKHVATSAAQALTPVCAELGGKDPFIVLDSVGKKRLPAVAATMLRGTFQSSGQNCIGIERVIASPGVYEPLLALVTDKVKALRIGFQEEGDVEEDATKYDVGAMISDSNFDRLERLIDDAVKQGARLLAGGRRYVHPRFPHGHYFTPTLLADVTPAMAIAQEECFGPILCMMRAEASTADAVLAVANAAPFGLGASVFGDEYGSEKDEIAKVVKGVKAGMVAINDFATYYAVQLPFGGVGGSGYGRFAGAEGLQSLCNAKSVCADRFGWLGVRTGLPPVVQYPVRSQNGGWSFVKGLITFGYGLSWGEKIRGLLELIRNS
ncbi:Meiotic Sister-Chromatid recombination aldehyde dehydrogenase [Sporothrix eucalyptigena]|uniref:aldehyde dehydrogenase (NAD(+)) n=1 Tax=Sporothrix eucalyptigena TaxID=1812306 RepID=A0ABP0CT79_9PEZI